MRLIFFLLMFCLGSFLSYGQDYSYQSPLIGAKKEGYHKIFLAPEIVNLLNGSKSDLRIYDKEGREVPYIFEKERELKDSLDFNLLKGFTYKQAENLELKTTVVNVLFRSPQRIGKLSFEFKGPVHFKREGQLLYMDSVIRRKKKRAVESAIPIEVSSQRPTAICIEEMYVKSFEIRIFNEDNPPLKFKSLAAFQRKYFLIAYLKKDEKYLLKFGNKSINPPSYDLPYFKTQLPESLPLIEVKNFEPLKSGLTSKPIPFFQNKLYLWMVLGVVGLGLAVLSYRLVKEMQ